MITIEYEHLVAFSVALIIAFFSTPIARRIAFRTGAVNVPRDNRRMHKKPMPLFGGLAIIAGFVIAMVYGFASRDLSEFLFFLSRPKSLGIIFGALIIVVLGIVDDIRPLKAGVKFVVQLLAASVVVATGTSIISITMPFTSGADNGMTYILGETIAFLISIFWIVGVTNAINLIDGLDGLAAGVSGIASASLFIVAVIRGQDDIALAAVSLAGAIFGFLPYNFNPAKIFMGDTGATFLGFILAVLSIEGTLKSVTTLALAIPILVLGLPIFDTLFAILRRIANGRPIGEGDRGHIHHRLIDMGFSHKMSVVILYVISGALGLLSIVLVDKGLLPSIILLILIVMFMVGGARNISEMNKDLPINGHPAKTGKEKGVDEASLEAASGLQHSEEPGKPAEGSDTTDKDKGAGS
ncbi:MraY family glycosyltransferase [Thermoclostridium caenicola]|uniref:UDP-GlcNAc:undecaprenyl-phosphate GlcNAc-1-phosphate transferase n=1 Tax=Thermoclostridium caenicola TaxID=659425 RepID=A0A1M6E7M6_9FIRM|nr:MraY family glycosyltransferase [Thermoclostridium caenicola]SHI81451.1 UDP-GlcNAc:undecaprenyl-phosphate GlcNAc-1-phosphate transferase [Thermoclostridium caenicola]